MGWPSWWWCTTRAAARERRRPPSCQRLERVLTLTAVGVDPDDVAEVVQAVGPGAAPAAVPHAAHRRVDLVVDRGRVDVDDARQDARGELEAPVGVAGEDRRR